MSVASSAASSRVVSYNEDEMTVESMLSVIVTQIQGALNGLEGKLNAMCMLDDQKMEPLADFKEGVELEDATTDLCSLIVSTLKHLQPVVTELRGKAPNAEAKKWHAAHKMERKNELALERLALANEKSTAPTSTNVA